MALLRQLLSTAGDGSGTTTGASDSSVTPVELSIEPAGGQEFRISSLTVLVEDNIALLGDVFAGAGVLTNGIRLQVKDGDDVVLLTVDAAVPIKRIADLLQIGAAEAGDATGTNKFKAYKLTFASPIVLNGNTPSRLCATHNDNLSSLVLLRYVAEGISRGQPTA